VSKRKGYTRYLVGFDDFKAELNAGAKRVRKWKEQGAPISKVGNDYRAKTDELLDWLLEKDREEESAA